jgi:rhodanese-related sulfurtransferase
MGRALLAGDVRGGALVVDVRTRSEFRAGSYPGALSIPLRELSRRLDTLPRDARIVVYCGTGCRSAVAAGLLVRAGFSEVVDAGAVLERQA